MSQIRVILLGRNRLFLQGLANLLPQDRFEVLGEAGSVQELTDSVDMSRLSTGEVVLLDPPSDRDEMAEEQRAARALLPGAVVVVLSDALCPRSLSASLASGAKGFLLKTISVEALLHSIELARLGETVLPTKLASLLVNGMPETNAEDMPDFTSIGLSERESQILSCLVAGNSNKVIANRLHITEATVKVHMKSLLRKIKVSNRTQAAIWAVNHGVTQPTAMAAE